MIEWDVEENLTDYFEELLQHFNSHKDTLNYAFTREIVGNYGSVNGKIARLMSTTFNPHLYTSGQNEDLWKHMVDEGMSIIEIMYTGRYLHEEYPIGKAKVWWEFADKNNQNKLGRDYSWYQETGEDPIAKSEDAKHKGAISKGLSSATSKDLNKTAQYMEDIMKLRTLNHPRMGSRR